MPLVFLFQWVVQPVRDDVDMIVSPSQHALGKANGNWFEDYLHEGNRKDGVNKCRHFLGSGAIRARMIAT